MMNISSIVNEDSADISLPILGSIEHTCLTMHVDIIDISSQTDDTLNCVDSVLSTSIVNRSLPILVFVVEVACVLKKNLEHLVLSFSGCIVDGCLSESVLVSCLDALVDEELDHFDALNRVFN
jgi:hypothetical protein